MSNLLTLDDIGSLERQIEQLIDYKPIPEHEVKALCDKVFQPLIKVVGERNLVQGEQCAASKMPSDYLRGHPWLVPRSHGAL